MTDDLPSFSWDEHTLVVEYANGDVDMAEMINVLEEETDDEEDDTCIMFGTFEMEDIPVALTGCPGDTSFDVRFSTFFYQKCVLWVINYTQLDHCSYREH